MIRPGAATAGAAAILALAGCGGSSGGPAAQPSTTSSTPSTPTGGCTPASVLPKPAGHFSAPKMTIKPETYTGTIVTNCGTIVIALDGKAAPATVNSFAFLASKHFFDNTICHRLTTSIIYVLQCGDPTASGGGGPGYTIPDEHLGAIKNRTYPAGTVAMANTGQPHTGGSQFFLVYQDSGLDPNYTPFGRITAGLDVLRRIAALGTDNSHGQGDGSPNVPVVIRSFTVTPGAPTKS
jgi:peptidyl-prolyl cis-trans isomerase B (cyclophilin B)